MEWPIALRIGMALAHRLTGQRSSLGKNVAESANTEGLGLVPSIYILSQWLQFRTSNAILPPPPASGMYMGTDEHSSKILINVKINKNYKKRNGTKTWALDNTKSPSYQAW